MVPKIPLLFLSSLWNLAKLSQLHSLKFRVLLNCVM